ncbi:hypothetical protein SJAG_03689 [Schizosaccharomyces japonicus yFS275]|uniref:Uncharacterized protein n=1 Tax=Schizosaccharomyces japonicus (strain yFS275 / FY16936) TaxID=402676 RepID=B6K4X5_SCHJY|nr:hypothetical protein SJAG_03689 [Schizosaccharomyces japonicus yFS275]EEB08532.1 hypothetical protein SJAG_03689 [Schizosaccharomyces japonicus yFS275]
MSGNCLTKEQLLSLTKKQALRNYQEVAYNIAIKQNTLLVMNTGAGKTLLAIKLIEYVLEQENSTCEKTSKRISIFLVPKVPLVEQQADYVQTQLNRPVGRFCGEISNLYHDNVFAEKFMKNDVVVVTGGLLFECLSKGFIKLSDVNLLIFDECHHASKDDVYVRIMKYFYHEPLREHPETIMPRVFGMTASPLMGNKWALEKEFNKLEDIYDSKLCIITDEDLGKELRSPKTFILQYSIEDFSTQSKVSDRFWKLTENFDRLKQIITRVVTETVELGLWFGDYSWQFFLRHALKKYDARRLRGAEVPKEEVLAFEALQEEVRKANLLTTSKQLRKPKLNGIDVTNKVIILYKFLRNLFATNSTARVIIFVERKVTAFLLKLFFDKIDFEGIRVESLVGNGSNQAGDEQMSYKLQKEVIRRFKHGSANVLVATAIAEEGLDIPSCDVVFRFSLCKTAIQLIQSKGRARANTSIFVNLLSEDEKELFSELCTKEIILKETLYAYCCTRSPKVEFDNNITDFFNDDNELYKIEETGALLTPFIAVSLLYGLCQRIPSDPYTLYLPEFKIQNEGEHFTCELRLPAILKIPPYITPPCRNKKKAKRYAAVKACLQLIESELIDKRLRIKTFYDELLEAEKEEQEHSMKNLPQQKWERCTPSVWQVKKHVKTVYATVIFVDSLEGESSFKCYPLLYIIPDCPFSVAGPLRLNSAKNRIDVLCHTIPTCFALDLELREELDKFTLFMLQLGLSKTLISTSSPSYWFAPLHGSYTSFESLFTIPSNAREDLRTIINVELLRKCLSENTPLHPKLLDTLSPSSLLCSAKGYYTDHHQFHSLQTSDKLGAKDEETKTFVNVIRCPLRTNFLLFQSRAVATQGAKRRKRETRVQRIEVTKLLIMPFPYEIRNSALLLPSLLYMFEQVHLVDALRVRLQAKISTKSLLEASTSPGSVLPFDYDRYEFYGDTFLKLAASNSVFLSYLWVPECKLHIERKRIIRNSTLFTISKKHDLPGFLLSEPFVIKTFIPFGYQPTQKSKNKMERSQLLANKTVADIVESSLGACLYDSGVDEALALGTRLGLNFYKTTKWDEWNSVFNVENLVPSAENDCFKHASGLESLVGYTFKHPGLLKIAFTHASYVKTTQTAVNYQQLEFLGDAVLDFIVVRYLFKKYQNKTAAELTDTKSFYVCNKSLAYVSFKLGLYDFMLQDNEDIRNAYKEYKSVIDKLQQDTKIDSNHPTPSEKFWLLIEPPKFLSDIFESFVCAVYLDSGFQFSALEPFLKFLVEELGDYEGVFNEPPVFSQINQHLQKQGCKQYKFQCVIIDEEEKSDLLYTKAVTHHYEYSLIIHDEIVCSAKALNKKNSQKLLSLALKELYQKASVRLFRKCECQLSNSD